MQSGYIMARVYTSEAQIPVVGAVFTVTEAVDENEILVGVRKTDENGKTTFIPVDAPDIELSLSPGNPSPFSSVNVRVDHPDFVTQYVEGVQIFPGQVSVQEASLIPLSVNNNPQSSAERYFVTKQDL